MKKVDKVKNNLRTKNLPYLSFLDDTMQEGMSNKYRQLQFLHKKSFQEIASPKIEGANFELELVDLLRPENS